MRLKEGKINLQSKMSFIKAPEAGYETDFFKTIFKEGEGYSKFWDKQHPNYVACLFSALTQDPNLVQVLVNLSVPEHSKKSILHLGLWKIFCLALKKIFYSMLILLSKLNITSYVTLNGSLNGIT